MLSGAGCFAFACLVLQQNPKNPLHRSFAQLSLSLALWNLGFFFLESTHNTLWEAVLFFGTFSIPGSVFDFVSAYLKTALKRWESRLRGGVYLVGGLFYLTIFTPLFDLKVWNIATMIYIFPVVGFSLWRLKEKLKSTVHPMQKKQLQVLFYGGCVVMLLSPSDLVQVFGESFPRLGSLATLIYLYVVATGILRYHLLDLQEVMQREQLALVGEMSAGLAHEVRNPLATIKGAVQYLNPSQYSGEVKEFLDIILEETNRLNGVVQRFLDYARPFKKDLSLEFIDDLIASIVKRVKKNLSSEPLITFNSKIAHHQIELDKAQMDQVIFNLLTNAIDAMVKGGRIEITGEAQRDCFMLSIKDQGEGISEEMLPKIFDPFQTKKEKGIGLGLAICKRIIIGHEGTIRVVSTLGKGAEFILTLPFRQTEKEVAYAS
ncbi:MAG: ATP-binding protein [Nitrospiria bacterium]